LFARPDSDGAARAKDFYEFWAQLVSQATPKRNQKFFASFFQKRSACLFLSLILYFLLFGFVLDRPLSLGVLRLELEGKAARLAALPGPKLVILAGSNGPYSHSCVVLGAMLRMPCENAGIAVGIGLDEVFARYGPALQAGDVVYMPMELQQYVASRAAYRAGVDGGMMWRHERGVLAGLAPDRVLGAMFCCDVADAMESLAEMPLAVAGVIDPRAMLAREYDEEGDRVDNAGPAAAWLLAAPSRGVPGAGEIEAGYGTRLIAAFVARMRAKGVVVVGGLPVDFTDARMPAGTLDAVRAVYGARWFLVLPNESRYPRRDFFNSEDHLDRACQAAQSVLVAQGLGRLLGRGVGAAPAVGCCATLRNNGCA